VWTVEFGPSPRELYRHRHVFEVIERPHRLVLASTETRLDGSSFHTKLEFTFEARGWKTLMTMTQRGFPTAELREEHERGVPNAFARLDRLIQLSGTPTDARARLGAVTTRERAAGPEPRPHRDRLKRRGLLFRGRKQRVSCGVGQTTAWDDFG
jgi:hypothetical protein